MEKSDKRGNRVEVLSPLCRLELRLPVSFGANVWVGMMGGKMEGKTVEVSGFREANLVVFWLILVRILVY